MSRVELPSVDTHDIECYLNEHIPLAKAMQVKVQQVDDAVVRLAAPLNANINQHGTVFGGSASILAILAGWVMVYRRLKINEFQGRIVIQHNRIDYDRPITSAFTAVCRAPTEEAWDTFETSLDRWGKGRINLESTLLCGGEKTGHFEGSYVALNS